MDKRSPAIKTLTDPKQTARHGCTTLQGCTSFPRTVSCLICLPFFRVFGSLLHSGLLPNLRPDQPRYCRLRDASSRNTRHRFVWLVEIVRRATEQHVRKIVQAPHSVISRVWNTPQTYERASKRSSSTDRHTHINLLSWVLGSSSRESPAKVIHLRFQRAYWLQPPLGLRLRRSSAYMVLTLYITLLLQSIHVGSVSVALTATQRPCRHRSPHLSATRPRPSLGS